MSNAGILLQQRLPYSLNLVLVPTNQATPLILPII